MRLEEHHKEAEADEDHNVHILEHRVVLPHVVLGGELAVDGRAIRRMDTLTVLGEEEVQDNDNDLTNQVNRLEGSRSVFHSTFLFNFD